MAQRERERTPEEAIAPAEQATRDLLRQMGSIAPLIPRVESGGRRDAVAQVDAQARERVQALAQYSERLRGLLLTGDALTRPAVEREVGGILGGDRSLYTGPLQALGQAAEAAVAARSRGDASLARALAGRVSDGLGALRETYRTDVRMGAIGVSDEVRQGFRANIYDEVRSGATPQDQELFRSRAQLIRRTGEILTEHGDTLSIESPRMEAMRRQAEETIVVLGQGARTDAREGATRSERFTRDMAQQFGRHLDSFESELRGIERNMAVASAGRLGNFSSQFLHFMGTVGNEGLRRAIGELREELDTLGQRVRRGERVREDEIRQAESEIALIENARTEILQGRTGAAVAGEEEALGRALSSLRLAARLRAMDRLVAQGEPRRRIGAEAAARQVLGSGASGEQVAALVGQYGRARGDMQGALAGLIRIAGIQRFIAMQIARAQTQADKTALRNLGRGLEDGTTTLPEAMRELSSRFAGQLRALASGPRAVRDEGIRAIIARIAGRLSEGEPDFATLARAAQALGLAGEIRSEEGRLGARAYSQIRGGAMEVLRRSMRAIELGYADEAAMQLELAKRFRQAASDPAMREALGGMSARLGLAANLRAMYGLVNHPEEARRMSAPSAARRILEESNPGIEISDEQVAALAEIFEREGGSAESLQRYLERTGMEGAAFVQLLSRRDAIRALAGSSPRGNARALYQGVLDTIGSVLGRLSRGEEVSEAAIRGVQAQAVIIAGGQELITNTFVTSRDPAIQQEQLSQLDGLRNLRDVLRGQSGSARERAASIYMRGMELLARGNMDDALCFFLFAQAYAASGSERDRTRIFELSERFSRAGLGAGEVEALPEGQRPISADDARFFSRAFLDRALGQGRIRDRALRGTFTEYSDLAIGARERGDSDGAGIILETSRQYGRAAALNTADERVRAVLAIEQGAEGIPSLERLRAALSGESPQRLAQALGAREAAQEEEALQVYSTRMAGLQLGLDAVDYAARDVRTDTAAARSRYRTEARRLDTLMRRARDASERQRLVEHRGIVDLERTSSRLDEARAGHEEGVTLLRQALERRRDALSSTDEGERNRLNSEAAELFARGRLLIESTEGLQATTLAVHRSIIGVFTLRRESGRDALDRAGRAYSEVSAAVREAEGPLGQSEISIHRTRLRSASGDLRMGTSEIARQRGIQAAVASLLERARRLSETNRVNGRLHGDVMLPLPPGREGPGERAYDQDAIEAHIERGRRLARSERISESSHALGVASVDISAGVEAAAVSRRHWSLLEGATPSERESGMEYYDSVSLLGRLDDARAAARRGNLTEAARLIDETSGNRRVWGRQQELNNGANMEDGIAAGSEASARAFGRWADDYYYREETGVLAGTLKSTDDQRAYGQLRQRHLEAETALIERAHRAGHEPGASELLTLRTRHREEEDRFLTSHERTGREPDRARLRALRHNIDALGQVGIMANLAGDARVQADSARRRAAELRTARDAVIGVEDVPESSENLAEALATAYIDSELERRRTGGTMTLAELSRASPQLLMGIQEQLEERGRLIREAEAAGSESEARSLREQAAAIDTRIMRGMYSDPDRMARAAAWLRGRGEISEGLALGLASYSGHYSGVTHFQEHSRDWNISATAADRYLESTSAFADQLRRARPFGISERATRQSLISHSARFMQIALYASAHPGTLGRDIREGRSIMLPEIGGGSDGPGLIVRRGDDIYEDVVLRADSDQDTLVNLWRQSSEGVLVSLASLSQGLGEERVPQTEEERRARDQMGAYTWRLLTLHHPVAISVRDEDLRTTFATWGFRIDPETNQVRELRLSAEEQEVLAGAAQSVAQARAQVMNVASSLKTFASTDDGRAALRAIEVQMSEVRAVLTTERGNGLLDIASSRESPGDNPISAERLAEFSHTLRDSAGRTDRLVAASIREGLGDDKVVFWTSAGLKIVGYGALAFTGYGLPVAVAGAMETLASAEEQRISLGGTEQMTDLELGLRYGSFAVAGLGVVTAGVGSVFSGIGGEVGTFGTQGTALVSPELVAASRTLQGLQSFSRGAGIALIIGGTGLGIGEIANMALYGGPDVGFGDYAFAFFNAAQPFLQIGGMRAMSMRPSLMYSTSFGATMYRGFMGMMFGVSRREIIATQHFEMRQAMAGMMLSRSRATAHAWSEGLARGVRPPGVSAADFEAAQGAVRTLASGRMPPQEAIARIARGQAEQDASALAAVGQRLGRDLEAHEGMALLQHYSDARGMPRPINPDEAASLLRGYGDYVEARVRTLSREGQDRLSGLRTARPLEHGEVLALIAEYGNNMPGAGEASRYLDRVRRQGAGGRSPFFSLSDYAAMQEGEAAAPAGGPARAGRPADRIRARALEAEARRSLEAVSSELEGAMNITLTSGEEPVYTHPSRRGGRYGRQQMEMARDLAAAADYIRTHEGEAPPGISSDALARARELAGSIGRPTDFRVAGSDRAAQMSAALAALSDVPEFTRLAIPAAEVPIPLARRREGLPPLIEEQLRNNPPGARVVAGDIADVLAGRGVETPELSSALSRIRAARPEERNALIPDEARRIAYARDETRLFFELRRRGISGQAAEDAGLMLRAMHGLLEVSPGNSRFFDIRIAEAVSGRMEATHDIVDAVIFAAPTVRGRGAGTARAPRRTYEQRLDEALEIALRPRLEGVSERDRGAAFVRAQRLAEAFVEYAEAERTISNPRLRPERIDAIRRRLGIGDEEHNFLIVRSGLGAAEVGRGIARLVSGGEAPAERARPAPSGRREALRDAERAILSPEVMRQVQEAISAAEAPELAYGRTLRAGAEAQAENVGIWENGAILGHVEDIALGIVQRRAAQLETALVRGSRPSWMRQADFQSAQDAVRIRMAGGASRGEAVRIVAESRQSLEAVIVALDKSGLGDIDRTTGDALGTRQGRGPADIISREVFEQMVHRAAAILRERGYELTADALLGAGMCDERALVAVGRGAERGEVMAALRRARDEVNAQLNPELRASIEEEGGPIPLVPDGYVQDIREARNTLRELDLQRRADAARRGGGYGQVSHEDEGRLFIEIARRRLGAGAGEAAVGEEAARIRQYFGVPDLRTFQVEMGSRTLSLHEWAGLYLRHTDLVGSFAAETEVVRIRPGMRRGELHDAYERAERAGAAFTSDVASSLGIRGRESFDERLGTMRPIGAGSVDAPGMRIEVGEDRRVRIQEADIMQVYFRLNESGREEAAMALSRFITTTGDDAGIEIRPETRSEASRYYLANRERLRPGEAGGAASEENITRIARVMERSGVNPSEAMMLIRAAESDEGIPLALFAETVTRKGYTFARGDIGFSEGNTFVSHSGMNQLGQAGVDAIFESTRAPDGSSTARAMGDMQWALRAGTSDEALFQRLSGMFRDAGISGIDVGLRVVEVRQGRISGMRDLSRAPDGSTRRVPIETGTPADASIREIRAAFAGMGMGMPSRLSAAVFDSSSFTVHMSHPYTRDAQGVVMRALFGQRAEALQRTFDGYEGAPTEIFARLSADRSPEGRRTVGEYLIYRLSREISGRRALRRIRDVDSWLTSRIADAESSGDLRANAFYTAMRRELVRFAREEGPAVMERFAKFGEGSRPAGPSGGPGRERPPSGLPRITGRSGERGRGQGRAGGLLMQLAGRDSRGRPANLADFVRRAVLADEAGRADMLGSLPDEVRRLVEPLTRERDAFAQAVLRSARDRNDDAFNRYVDTFGARRLRGIASDIAREHGPEAGAPSMRAAVGDTPRPVEGRLIEAGETPFSRSRAGMEPTRAMFGGGPRDAHARPVAIAAAPAAGERAAGGRPGGRAAAARVPREPEARRIAGFRERPSDPADAFAYDLALIRAAQGGRARPNTEDYMFAAQARAGLGALEESMVLSVNRGAVTTESAPGEGPHVDMHFGARDGRTEYRLRIYRDRIAIVGTNMDILGDEGRAAFIRYAQARMDPQIRALAGSFEPVMSQIRAGNIGLASDLARRISSGERPALVGLGAGQVITRLSDVSAPPDAIRQALDSFMILDAGAQDHAIRMLRQSSEAAEDRAVALDEAGNHADASVAHNAASALRRRAATLEEMRALNSHIGQQLERVYGLEPGALLRIYRESGSDAPAARRALADRLGIRTGLDRDDAIFRIITSGDLLTRLRELHPVVRDIPPGSRQFTIEAMGEGMVGAYRVGVYDGTNWHYEFIKTLDMRSDQGGAVRLVLSSVPAPRTVTTAPDGTVLEYGISQNLGEFSGALRLAGREIPMSAVDAQSIFRMEQSPALMRIFNERPELFYEQMGFTLAAQLAVGASDGHEVNTWAMLMRIDNPDPQTLAALRSHGYTVMDDGHGNHTLFMIGRIDTDDCAGTYQATGTRGNMDFSPMLERFGSEHFLHRLFVNLTQIRNRQEALRAGAWAFEVPAARVDELRASGWTIRSDSAGRNIIETYSRQDSDTLRSSGLSAISAPSREPRFLSVLGVFDEAFGTGGDGPIFRGMERWMRDVGGTGEYQDAMRAELTRRAGQPAGVSWTVTESDRRRELRLSGATRHGMPNNGEEYMPVFGRDGRTVLLPDFERVSGVDAWPEEVSRLFPPNRRVFVAPLTEVQAATMGESVLRFGDRYFGVYPSRETVPAALRGREVWAVRHIGHIRAGAGFSEATGIPSASMGAAHAFDAIAASGSEGMRSGIARIRQLLEVAERREGARAEAGGDAGLAAYNAWRYPRGFDEDVLPSRPR